jgi:tRNA threonylcarbamoyladenosine biosynthesis protein TsaB
MKILAFDTATAACTVAVSANHEILQRTEIAPQRHAELILPMIDSLLQEAGISLQQLDAIAVGRGPGSFMGVRIAAGVAQALGYAANLPIMPISTLQILAQTAYLQTCKENIIAGWDARMQAIYWGIYHLDNQGIMSPIQPDTLSLPHEINFNREKTYLMAGNAWPTYRQQLDPMIQSSPTIADIYPQAHVMISIAQMLYQQGKLCSPFEIEPVYLRDHIVHSKSM